jgi:RNA polymerase sigma-70 factor, ECF subfamily
MADYTPTEHFVRSLTEYQSRLYAYIVAMLGDADAAGDVFQNTNVAIWRKAAEYTEGTNFWAWTSRIAHFEVLAFRKRRQRDRHVFDDGLLANIAEEAAR